FLSRHDGLRRDLPPFPARRSSDLWAAGSHQRAVASAAFLAEEIAPYTLTSRAGETVVADDDGVRADTTPESLARLRGAFAATGRSEEHTSELQSRENLVCGLLLEK